MKKNNRNVIGLQDSLILNKFIINLMEDDFATLNLMLNSRSLEGIDIDNESYYYKALINRTVERKILTNQKLKEYDQNIVKFTKEINKNRSIKIKWKYFQYLSLLFTEIYLDLYFNNKEFLLKELNTLVSIFNKENYLDISNYTEKDLEKIAFWSATGSGKTLIMHVNIMQFVNYSKKSNIELDNILLVTPNESLSYQHLDEFKNSNLNAQLFEKDMDSYSLFHEINILIIDIYKLKEVDGDKTISIDTFEGKNLVIVDEGHRGSTGSDWKLKRNILSENGFTFEYSATFGQVASRNKDLYNEYSKNILFDYSYKHFYNDGYGKDYNIINLENTLYDEEKNKYFTACILSFYQQQLIFKENLEVIKEFNIENPLLVFVGSSVNAVKKVNKINVSDVTEIIRYFAYFINEDSKIKNYLFSLINGESGFFDSFGNDIFSNSFSYIYSKKLNVDNLYKDIISTVFNSSNNRRILKIERLKQDDNELRLKIDGSKPFGIINVGDAKSLEKLCANISSVITEEIIFGESYFNSLNSTESDINILIGSKKFSEGWSSWRVSSMGLLNIGKNEGSQIIQLFGRGVRLKGYEMSLKRSEFIAKEIDINAKNKSFIKILETLNIFGINASYMDAFKGYLQEEGLFIEKKEKKITIPTQVKEIKGLKSLRISMNADFDNIKKSILFKLTNDIHKNKIVLNWYSKISMFTSTNAHLINVLKNEEYFKEAHLNFINYDQLYFELVKYKNEKKYYNLKVSKEELKHILSDNSWYIIQIPSIYMELSHWDNVHLWNEISIILLRKYMDKIYYYEKNKYEAPFIELYDYDLVTEGNYIKNYEITTRTFQDEENLYSVFFKDLDVNEIKEQKIGDIKIFEDKFHLYNPIIYFHKSKNQFVEISPIPLNQFEYKFMKDLNEYLSSNDDFMIDKKIYLLRNQSRGRGLGFFEGGNFYPDFIMWIIYQEKQYINFIDPKGIRNVSIYDEKIQFSKKIKEIESRINNKEINLNSFILSNTPYKSLINIGPDLTIEKLEESNVLFMVNDNTHYLHQMFSAILESKYN